MRLLLDQNLSYRLVGALSDLFPDSTHLARVGLERASDVEIWEYARGHGYAIVSKDSDAGDLALVWGFPPSIVWIRRGNCSTDDIEKLLRANADTIREVVQSESGGIIHLY